MPFIVFIGGESRLGKLVSVVMGLAPTPEALRSMIEDASPFELKILGAEPGGEDEHRELQKRFAPALMKGLWYRPSEDLLEYVKGLLPLEGQGPTKRVSLDLEPQDFADLEVFVREKGLKTKSALLRRALRFYRALHRYQAQGFVIQAIRNGRLVQFPDLDDIRD